MKLYVGARDYRPDGFKTVDLDTTHNPDFVADIRDLNGIADASCSEVVASAVLEHIDWPDGFLALSEFARVLEIDGVLKISVPDMALLMRMILHGDSSFHVMGLVYGVGGRGNTLEQHRYGYTVGMLVDVLEVLGFGKFDWWNSDLPDASNGWVPRYLNQHVGCDQNVSAVKVSPPAVPPRALYEALCADPLGDFSAIAADLIASSGPVQNANEASRIYQRLHFQLIEARQRIKYLENLVAQAP